MDDNHRLTVRSVERALDILICFIDNHELTLTQIAKRTDINKSTVHRLLATLEQRGFLLRNADTDKYRLGYRVWELSTNLSKAGDPAVLFLPEMERLRDALDETISLYVRDGNERIRIQAIESRQTIRRVAPIGVRLPLAVGASSKVLVAYEEDAAQTVILGDPDWPDTTEKDWYKKQLAQIRVSGYATSVEEREPGTSALSAPILSHHGRLVAALAVSGPAGRLTVAKMNQIAPRVIEAAQRMGRMVN